MASDTAWSLLAGVSEDDRRRLFAVARRRRFSAGEFVFFEGERADSLHLVEAGRFSIRAGTAFGDQAMLSIVGEGGFFGELALVSPEGNRTATVKALDKAETIVVDRDEFERLRTRFPSVDRVLVEALALRVQQLSALLVEGLYTPVETRILKRLLELAHAWGDEREGTVVPLTQQDIAELAGTTRPTANRVLRAAEAEGLLRISRGRVELLDLEGMARRAGSV